MRKHLNLLREFSFPLLLGAVIAIGWANLDSHSYHAFLEEPIIAGLSLHFITNDLFMAFFFGIAAVEITQSCLPGGDLYPLKRALNPLMATIGGVVGPVGLYLLLNALFGSADLTRGWGIPTATDIAFAWLAARSVFGLHHPAISFLLLLAVADDALGLIIIAVFYGDPLTPAAPAWLLLTAGAMALCWFFRRIRVMNYWPYLIAGGGLSWLGLFLAHMHPALALVFVIPFLPHAPTEQAHLFDLAPGELAPLSRFEHDWKLFVDLGLFMFGLVNSGVAFSHIGTATWLVLTSLVAGKMIGVFFFGILAVWLGYPLPTGIGKRELAAIGLLAGIGFTVALFIAGEAFSDPVYAGGAKIGAMLSLFAGIPALVLMRVAKRKTPEVQVCDAPD